MSRALYRDLRRLVERGLLVEGPIVGTGWRALSPTPAGLARAATLRARAGDGGLRSLAALDTIRRELDGLSFAELLARVYDVYPEYAVRSVFRRP